MCMPARGLPLHPHSLMLFGHAATQVCCSSCHERRGSTPSGQPVSCPQICRTESPYWMLDALSRAHQLNLCHSMASMLRSSWYLAQYLQNLPSSNSTPA